MTPEQKIKHAILILVAAPSPPPEATAETIDALYEDAEEDCYDVKYDFREGQVETEIPCEYSRHYEAKSVAAKMPDGSWVGWTYWYGGGKYGEPESIDWMDEAYDLTCVEEEKLVVVRTFSKVNGAAEEC